LIPKLYSIENQLPFREACATDVHHRLNHVYNNEGITPPLESNIKKETSKCLEAR